MILPSTALLAATASEELLGGYKEPETPLHVAGRVAFVLMVIAVGWLERIQFRLRFLETRTWWASNGRDVLNAVAFLLLAGALGLIGFGGPLALVVASTVLILMIALQSALGSREHGTVLSVVAALVLGAPVFVVPRAVDQAFRALLLWLFR